MSIPKMLKFIEFRKLSEDATTFNQTETPHLGSPSDMGHTVQGIHYSHKAGLHELHGGMFGTGLKGAESKRLAETHDHRIKSRVYFYNKQPHHGTNLPQAEGGLGPHVHSATLHGIFHLDHATDEQRAKITEHKQKYLTHPHADKSNAFESAVVDAGFRGYTNGHVTIVLNHKTVPTKYEGHKFELKKAA